MAATQRTRLPNGERVRRKYTILSSRPAGAAAEVKSLSGRPTFCFVTSLLGESNARLATLLYFVKKALAVNTSRFSFPGDKAAVFSTVRKALGTQARKSCASLQSNQSLSLSFLGR
jgi:hypothetical protein